jgi:peptidoglycan/LPS O-acetylase OafA/YrhL
MDSIKSGSDLAGPSKHLDFLDGLRGIAILMVVAYHTFYTNPAGGEAARRVHGLIQTGWMGVPIFFVLSGFLISFPFIKRRAGDPHFYCSGGYFQRRAGKVIPPYFLSIVLFTIYYVFRFSDYTYLRDALHWALGLTNFIRAERGFNCYWSLLVEIHFYLLLPLGFFLTRGWSARRTVIALFFLLFTGPLLARQWTWPEQGSLPEILFVMVRFPCQLDYFAWGILFAGIWAPLSHSGPEFRALSILGYAGVVLLMVCSMLFGLWGELFDLHSHPTRWSTEAYHLLPGAAVFLLLFFAFDPGCFGARVLSHSALRFVGLVSYEWFLFHQPVVQYFAEWVGPTNGSVIRYAVKTALPLVLTFGFSGAVFFYFSRPLLNRIRNFRPGAAR